MLKNTPQVQKSVKKVLKICTNCQKITKQKLYYCAKKRLPKLSKIPCGLKKGPKKFKKLLKHSRKVQKCPKNMQQSCQKNSPKKMIEHVPKMLESGKRRKKKLHSRAKTYNNKIVHEIGRN